MPSRHPPLKGRRQRSRPRRPLLPRPCRLLLRILSPHGIDALEKTNVALERRLGAAEKALDLLLNLNRETFQTHAQRMAELDKELGRL